MIGSTGYDYERFVRPLYSYADADRLAEVPRGTSNRWVKGYRYFNEHGERIAQPSVTAGLNEEGDGAVSFFDLIGVKAIDGLRKAGFSLKAIRKVVDCCQDWLGVEYPLVTHRFKVDRKQIFIEAGDERLENVLGNRGMLAWDAVLDPFLETIDYHQEFARRWWPRGKGVKVVIDSDYGFGFPVIAGSGVRTEIVAERRRVGEAYGEIAYDFGVSIPEVEDALKYEMPNAA
ncbi:MAG: DUF433 domain-containing protein [Rubrobacter sp.]|jgi:uncharacterized protein (DUF433 family)|nr:DUF433 domain-containing protein [Rubrobacter sp.]